MCRLFMITIQSPYPIIVYSVAKYRSPEVIYLLTSTKLNVQEQMV